MALKLDKMTVKQLDDVIAQAQQQKQAAYDLLSEQARSRIEAILAETGLTLDELYSKRKRSTETKGRKAAKFRNPANANETWSGYGRMPGWFIKAINAGASRENLMIGAARKATSAAKKAVKVPATAKKVAAGRKTAKHSPKVIKGSKRR